MLVSTFRVDVPTMRKCSCCDRDDKSFQRLSRVATGDQEQGYRTLALHQTDHCHRCDRMEATDA